jgi:four helix bundle protein
MLVGLRKAWETWKAHDDSVSYKAKEPVGVAEPLFNHEKLDVYRVALELMAFLVSLPCNKEQAMGLFRRIDEATPSVILNIAEGNGRYSELDHSRFLDLAEGSAFKVAAYLDLAVQKDFLFSKTLHSGRILLERVITMLSRM